MNMRILKNKKKYKKCIGFGKFAHKCIYGADGEGVTYDFLCTRCDELLKKYLKDKFEKLGNNADGKELGEQIDNESIVHMLRTIRKQKGKK